MRPRRSTTPGSSPRRSRLRGAPCLCAAEAHDRRSVTASGRRGGAMGRAATRAHDQYRVDDPKSFRLKHIAPTDAGSFRSKEHAQKELQAGTALLSELQAKLYAQDRWAV